MLRQQNDATEKQVVYRPCPGAHGLRKRKVAASPAVSGTTVASSYEKKWRENLSSITSSLASRPASRRTRGMILHVLWATYKKVARKVAL